MPPRDDGDLKPRTHRRMVLARGEAGVSECHAYGMPRLAHARQSLGRQVHEILTGRPSPPARPDDLARCTMDGFRNLLRAESFLGLGEELNVEVQGRVLEHRPV